MYTYAFDNQAFLITQLKGLEKQNILGSNAERHIVFISFFALFDSWFRLLYYNTPLILHVRFLTHPSTTWHMLL